MNVDQASQILGRLVATFPRPEMTEDAAMMWVTTLGELSYQPALAAVDAARRSCTWLPSHAEFIEMTHAESRRQAAVADWDRPALPPASPAELAASKHWLVVIRAALAKTTPPPRAAGFERPVDDLPEAVDDLEKGALSE